jgi:hypothetical protein
MANQDGEGNEARARQVEEWLRANDSICFTCPKMGKMTYENCARRHVAHNTQRWFGQTIDAPMTPMEKFCRQCPLGKIHAAKFGMARPTARPTVVKKERRRDANVADDGRRDAGAPVRRRRRARVVDARKRKGEGCRRRAGTRRSSR